MSFWNRVRIATLSRILLIMMVLTGVFFTFAFWFLFNLSQGLNENWFVIEQSLKMAQQEPQAINQASMNVMSSSLQNLSSWILVFLAFVPVAAGFFFVFMYVTLTHKIVKPISQLEKGIVAITDSNDFSQRIDQHSQDEVGVVIGRFNCLVDNLSDSFSQVNRVLENVSRGNFEDRCNSVVHGDLALLRDGLNSSIDSVSITMRALEKVASGISAGDFSVRVDERVKGSIRHEVDQAMKTMDAVIDEISAAMDKMNTGDFSGQISIEASGKLHSLKTAINESLAHIDGAVYDISQVVMAQASGNLSIELPKGKFKGQLHDLKNAINYSLLKMNEVVNVATDVSANVSLSAKEVSQGARDLSQRVQDQAISLEQTSSTMEQMTSQLHSTTQNAQQATEMALNVRQQTLQGVEIMEDTINAMHSIEESSHRISEIVTLIDSIAFQTNLLALNAAVEAARAGEHGRGFAVVAGEVRNLAQKSADAAKDIKKLIDETASRVERGSGLAKRTGQMLNQMNDSVEQVAKRIQEIAGAAAEQSHGVQQVNKAMSQLDSVTQQNAALVEQTNAAAESLSDQALLLQKEMAFFKTQNKQIATPRRLN
jgi:methyl-accepting chemotaxis protein